MGADYSLIIGYGVKRDKLFTEERREKKITRFDEKTGQPVEKTEYYRVSTLHDGREIPGTEPYEEFPDLRFGCEYAVLPHAGKALECVDMYNHLEAEIPDLPRKPNEAEIQRLIDTGVPSDVAKESKLMVLVQASY